MVRKNEEQFDTGGIMLKHTFLLGFNDLNIPTEDITEEMIDSYVKEKSQDFEWDFKFFLMTQYMGYIGKDENNKWVKEKSGNINNHCYYSGLPSPSAYENENPE